MSSVEISKSTDKRSDKYETDLYNVSEGDLCIFVFLYFCISEYLYVSIYLYFCIFDKYETVLFNFSESASVLL